MWQTCPDKPCLICRDTGIENERKKEGKREMESERGREGERKKKDFTSAGPARLGVQFQRAAATWGFDMCLFIIPCPSSRQALGLNRLIMHHAQSMLL